ncbi:hypothetical protein V8F20_008096 [Naviculisporaceae sp. PSN 640]
MSYPGAPGVSSNSHHSLPARPPQPSKPHGPGIQAGFQTAFPASSYPVTSVQGLLLTRAPRRLLIHQARSVRDYDDAMMMSSDHRVVPPISISRSSSGMPPITSFRKDLGISLRLPGLTTIRLSKVPRHRGG